MVDDDGDAIGEIAQALRVYIVRHPTAADTITGIRLWWLPQDEPLPLVELALHRLIQEGVVRRVTMGDGGELYTGAGPANGAEPR